MILGAVDANRRKSALHVRFQSVRDTIRDLAIPVLVLHHGYIAGGHSLRDWASTVADHLANAASKAVRRDLSICRRWVLGDGARISWTRQTCFDIVFAI